MMRQTTETGVAWTDETAWVGVDQAGLVLAINDQFTGEFGWRPETIVGRPLGVLMPEKFRDAHNLGFSRFVEFGKSTLLGQPLRLPMVTAAGETVMTETCIQAELRNGQWQFGALMARVEPDEER